MHIEAYTLADAYMQIRGLLQNAPLVETRGFKTKEVSPLMVTIENPRARLAYHPERHYNLAFNIAELATYITGVNNVGVLELFNPRIRKFSDDGETFYGAYGPRIEPFLEVVVNKLKSDKGTRQAAINIYRSDDITVTTNDVPCTLALQFLIRNGKLDMITYMRSNDIFWGFQYDVFNFTMIQEFVAHEVGIPIGQYYHITGSMHVYDYHFCMLEEVDVVQSIEMPELKLDFADYLITMDLMFRLKYIADVATPKNDLDRVILAYAVKKFGLDRKVEVPDWAKVFING